MMPFAELAETCADDAAKRVRTSQDAMPFPPCWNVAAPSVQVYDAVLPDPVAYRAAVLAQPFGDVTVGPAVFRGLAELGPVDELTAWIVAHLPALQPTLTFARQSPAGQQEPNYIHTDVDMGQWTGILYLNPDPPAGDGTTFWKHRETGAMQAQARTPDEALAEGAAWRDLSQWVPVATVPAAFNRLVIFEAPAFHSRAIADNYGAGQTARLIQVIFGRFTEARPCV